MKRLHKRKSSPVNIRLPVEWRDKAKALAHSQSTSSTRFTESDVYRNAIGAFLFDSIFTDSKGHGVTANSEDT